MQEFLGELIFRPPFKLCLLNWEQHSFPKLSQSQSGKSKI